MQLREIITTINDHCSQAEELQEQTQKLDQLLINLQMNDLNLIIDSDETLTEFLQLFQQKTINPQAKTAQGQISERVVENLLITCVSGLVFDKKYTKLSDLKLFNLICILSTKTKQQKAFIEPCLSMGVMYSYLIQKNYGKMADYNPTHKKIKQKFEEDIKFLVKIIAQIIENKNNDNNLHQDDMFVHLLQIVTKLVIKFPNLFKGQKAHLEHVLIDNIVLDIHNSFSEEVVDFAILILAQLPNCVLKSIEYMENLQSSLTMYFEIYQAITSHYSYGDYQNNEIQFSFAGKKPFTRKIFSSQNTTQNQNTQQQQQIQDEEQEILQKEDIISNEVFNKFVIQKQLQNFQKLICEMLKGIKKGIQIEFNTKKFLDVLQGIISEDLQQISKSNTKGFQDKIVSLSLERQNILDVSDYKDVCIFNIQSTLIIIRQILKTLDQTMILHIDWLYNSLYFLSNNILPQNPVLYVQFQKTLKSAFKILPLRMADFGQFYIFNSLSNPIQTILMIIQNFSMYHKKKDEIKVQDEIQYSKQHRSKKQNKEIAFEEKKQEQVTQGAISLDFMSKNEIASLLNSNLKVLTAYISSGCCGIDSNIENIAKLDSCLTRLFLYPQIIAQYLQKQSKKLLFTMFEEVLQNNTLKAEESLIWVEYEKFVNHYCVHEEDQSIVQTLKGGMYKIQATKVSKKLSQIDNTMLITSYIESLQQQYEAQQQEFLEQTKKEFQQKLEQQKEQQLQDEDQLEPKIQKKVKKSEQIEINENEGWGNNNNNDKENQNQIINILKQEQQLLLEGEGNNIVEQMENENFDDEDEVLKTFQNQNIQGIDDDEDEEDEQDNDDILQQHLLQENNYQNAINSMPKPCFE